MLKWPEGRPEDAYFVCSVNGCVIEHRSKRDMVEAGEWRIAAETVLWAAGVAASPLGAALGVPVDRVGRVLIQPDLHIPGHPDVFVIGESVADFSRCSAVVKGLAEEFGARRVVGTPITPHAVVGLAVGAAMAGLKPVVEVTAWSLALQALDPIVSSAAKTRYRSGGQLGVPIVLRGRNGLWSGSGPMHSVRSFSRIACR